VATAPKPVSNAEPTGSRTTLGVKAVGAALDGDHKWTRVSPMKTYNIHEAKTHFSRLVDAVAAGQEVVIAKAGKPVAKLVPVSAIAGARKLGALAGKVGEAPDCWDADPTIEELFYGGAVEPLPRRRVADQRSARGKTRKPRK
jgi:prevent-host-death family protein